MAKPVAADAAAFLGRTGDAATVAVAEQHLLVVRAMVKAYVRGKGFDEAGNPADDLGADHHTSTARLLSNPEHNVEQTTGPFSVRTQGHLQWLDAARAGRTEQVPEDRAMRPNIPVQRAYVSRFLTEEGQVWKAGDGEPVFDEQTGTYTDPPGHGLGRPGARATTSPRRGDRASKLSRLPLRPIPLRRDLPRRNSGRPWHVTVTVCPNEPELVGLRINLVDVPLDAWTVARQCVGEIATN